MKFMAAPDAGAEWPGRRRCPSCVRGNPRRKVISNKNGIQYLTDEDMMANDFRSASTSKRESQVIESDIGGLVRALFSENFVDRQNAREQLVKMGREVITFLIGLQYSREQHVRWEAMKVLSDIAHPDSVPILVNGLENSNSDVRWLAAEGLVEIGKPSLKPLMEALEERGESNLLREGAHHVLTGLRQKGLFEDSYGMIRILKDSSQFTKLRPTAELIRTKG